MSSRDASGLPRPPAARGRRGKWRPARPRCSEPCSGYSRMKGTSRRLPEGPESKRPRRRGGARRCPATAARGSRATTPRPHRTGSREDAHAAEDQRRAAPRPPRVTAARRTSGRRSRQSAADAGATSGRSPGRRRSTTTAARRPPRCSRAPLGSDPTREAAGRARAETRRLADDAPIVELGEGPAAQVFELADGHEQPSATANSKPSETVRRAAEGAEGSARSAAVSAAVRAGAAAQWPSRRPSPPPSTRPVTVSCAGAPIRPSRRMRSDDRPQGDAPVMRSWASSPASAAGKTEEPVFDGDALACARSVTEVSPSPRGAGARHTDGSDCPQGV